MSVNCFTLVLFAISTFMASISTSSSSSTISAITSLTGLLGFFASSGPAKSISSAGVASNPADFINHASKLRYALPIERVCAIDKIAYSSNFFLLYSKFEHIATPVATNCPVLMFLTSHFDIYFISTCPGSVPRLVKSVVSVIIGINPRAAPANCHPSTLTNCLP